MSDVNMMFDLRVIQREDGSWTVALIVPDDGDGYGSRQFPHSLLGAYGFKQDSWEGATLVDVMGDAIGDIDVALDDNE